MSDRAPSVREHAMLASSSELSWLALTTDQAQILSEVVAQNRSQICQQWSYGICDGLVQSLADIERAGGAYTHPPPLTRP